MPKVMPKAQTGKPADPVNGSTKSASSRPSQKPQKADLGDLSAEVVYPELMCFIHDGGDGVQHRQPLGADEMKAILGWESEKQFIARKTEGMTEAEKTRTNISYGDEYDFIDVNGEKVKCWNNQGNRPFMDGHAKELAQDYLMRHWADSRNGGKITLRLTADADELPEAWRRLTGKSHEFSEMTVNGETIIITRTGKVDSGQHRLIMGVFADQMWHKDPKWKKFWPERPTLECVVFVGVSDSPKVTRTLDNVAPRTEADTIFTGEAFRNIMIPINPMKPNGTKRPLNSTERSELSKMLASATDVVFRRTGAAHGEFTSYQTHSISDEFRSRHPTLEKFVWHLFQENRDRAFAKMDLSAGMCAGLAYLFGASYTPDEAYHLVEPDKRSEDGIKWDHKVKPTGVKQPMDCQSASEYFVTLLAKNDARVRAIADETARLKAESTSGASPDEKQGILCLAWGLFAEGNQINPTVFVDNGSGEKVPKGDLVLRTEVSEKTGKKVIVEHPNVGGIDIGKERKEREVKVKVSKEEIEAKKLEEKKRQAEENKKAVQEAQVRVKGYTALYLSMQEKNPNRILLWENDYKTGLIAWGKSAEVLCENLNLTRPKNPTGTPWCSIHPNDLKGAAAQMERAGHKLAVVRREKQDDGNWREWIADVGPDGVPIDPPVKSRAAAPAKVLAKSASPIKRK